MLNTIRTSRVELSECVVHCWKFPCECSSCISKVPCGSVKIKNLWKSVVYVVDGKIRYKILRKGCWKEPLEINFRKGKGSCVRGVVSFLGKLGDRGHIDIVFNNFYIVLSSRVYSKLNRIHYQNVELKSLPSVLHHFRNFDKRPSTIGFFITRFIRIRYETCAKHFSLFLLLYFCFSPWLS